MNSRMLITGLVCAALAVWVNGSASAQNPPPAAPDAPTGSPVSTQITYQGQLQHSGSAHTGPCTFEFRLFDAATAGVQVGPILTTTNVAVNNGIFAVGLDFGNQFTGDARWLQTAVKCGGDAGFTVLSPRQSQNAMPYAMGLKRSLVIGSPSDLASGLSQVRLTFGDEGVAASGAGRTGIGVLGTSFDGYGVVGANFPASGQGAGVKGTSTSGAGVYGLSGSGPGVFAQGSGAGYDAPGLRVDGLGANTIGLVVHNHNSTEAAITGDNNGPGALFKGISNGDLKFSVSPVGRMTTKVVEIQGGADLAEKFSEANGATSEPGMVMVIDADHPGQIKPSSSAYDRKVVGIVSGAGGVQPGLTLQQEGVLEGNTSLAIAGRVYVKANARAAAIEPGDLLTTSDLVGYAMKASDGSRSHGAVIGKAMTRLANGTGLVLVVVNLQ